MVVKILMVCLGNICRSPLAEAILASKLPSQSYKIDSAGTSGLHAGEQPDSRSISIAKKNGLDITYQRARQFKSEDFLMYDYIYAMDNSNYRDLIKLAPNKESKNKVKLILEELFPEGNANVPDPYYGSETGFSDVFKILNEACDVIAKKLKDHK